MSYNKGSIGFLTGDYQFYHSNNNHSDKFTAVVNVPPKDELLEFINDALLGNKDGCVMKVGVTKVIKKDQYNKAIGRQKSLLNLQTYIFKDFEMNLGKEGLVHLHFYTFDGPSLTFELKPNRKRAYLIGVR